MSEPERRDEIEGGFSRRALAWMIGSAVVSFAAALLLAAFGRELQPGPASFTDSYSFSALGHRGLAALLRAEGVGVATRRSNTGGRADLRHPLILAEPDPSWLDRGGEARLRELRREAVDTGAPVLLVLPKWGPGKPAKANREWLSSVSLLSQRAAVRPLAALGDKGLEGVTVARFEASGPLRCNAAFGARVTYAPDLEPVQLLVARPPLEAVVSCPGGALIALLSVAGQGQVFILADPDLINNQGLGRGDNAALILALLGRRLAVRGVVFEETIHGFESTRSLLAEAFRFPMVLAVAQGLLILALVLWAGMGRFGKPAPAGGAPPAGKKVLIDNTASLLAAGDGAADSAARYFRQTARAVADHFFLPPDLGETELFARLRKLTERRGSRLDLARIEDELRTLALEGKADGRAVALAGRLYAWRMEMTSVDRKSP